MRIVDVEYECLDLRVGSKTLTAIPTAFTMYKPYYQLLYSICHLTMYKAYSNSRIHTYIKG